MKLNNKTGFTAACFKFKVSTNKCKCKQLKKQANFMLEVFHLVHYLKIIECYWEDPLRNAKKIPWYFCK